jgi:hypothetical protein
MLSVIGITLLVLAGLFVLLFTVYFFNLDMKLVAIIYTLLGKHYDKMKRKNAL